MKPAAKVADVLNFIRRSGSLTTGNGGKPKSKVAARGGR